jgi:hypothetical protein
LIFKPEVFTSGFFIILRIPRAMPVVQKGF